MVARIGPKSGKPHRHFFKEWREYRKLSQERLADRLGTTGATVSRMENYQSQYNAGYLQALADALDCEPADLFHPPDRPSVDKLLEQSSPEMQKRVYDLVEQLLKTG